MTILQSIIEALESISANKLRSGLTILGIVIGVGAVIAMLAVGTGAQDTITGAISGIGTNLMFVFPGNRLEDVRNPEPLTLEDTEALRDEFLAPSVRLVTPILSGNRVVSFGGKSIRSSISGITPDYISATNIELTEGTTLTETHLLQRASVALVGPEIVTRLFEGRGTVIGESIRIDGQPFRIIGVMASKGGGSFGSQDNVILIPFSSAQARVLRRANNSVDMILVQTIDADSVDLATEEITEILRSRHRIFLGANDFTVFSQKDMVATAQQITGVFTIFIGGVAAISLLVGGIGIMNIMLVSVTERTREIGLRKAIGARKRDILLQFLTESSLLSMLGGIIGIILGWVLAFAIGQIATILGSPFNPVVGMDAILLATIFSAAVGLFFGIYPANRAANLVPVEALRYE